MTTQPRSKEYWEGYTASKQGFFDAVNPYKIGTDEAMDWNQGWLDGMGYES